MKRRYKILISIFCLAVVIVIGLYLSLIHLGLLEYIVNRVLQNQIGRIIPVRVYIGDIRGDYWSNLTVSDVLVTYDDSLTTYTIARIPELHARYSLMRLWRGQLDFEQIQIDSAEITLKKNDKGEWLIPRPEKKPKKERAAFDFEIYDFTLNNLSLNLIGPDDTLTFRDIIFDARFEGRENTYSAIIDRLSYRSSDARFNLASAGGIVTITGNNIIFKDFNIVTDSSNLKVGGMIIADKELEFKAAIDAEKLNLKEVSSFIDAGLDGELSIFGDVEYKSGRLSGDVSLSGNLLDFKLDSLWAKFDYDGKRLKFDSLDGFVFGGCYIGASGDIDLSKETQQYHLVGALERFNLSNLILDTYETDLNGRLNLAGRGFRPEEMVLDFVVNLNESDFDDYHFHSAVGYMTITADSIRFHEPFSIKHQDNQFVGSGILIYDGLVEIDGSTEFEDLSVFSGQTFIEEMGGRGGLDFKVYGELSNPNITGRFQSDSVWLYDIYSSDAVVTMQMEHFLFNREGQVELSLYSGTAYDVPFDSIVLDMAVDSQRVLIEKAHLVNEYADVKGRVRLDYAGYPQRVTVENIDIDLMGVFLNSDSPVVIDIDSLGYEIVTARLNRPRGYIAGKGRINLDDSIDFQLSSGALKIGPWIKLYSEEYDIDGMLSGQIDISGTLLSPVIDFQGNIDSLIYQSLLLGDLYSDFHYENEQIEIDSVSLKSEYGYYLADGRFPINLALAAVDIRFPEREQDIRIAARDLKLDMVSLLLDEVEDLQGEFAADFILSGTPQQPKINGSISLRKGRMKLYDLVLPLEDIYVDVKMINEVVYIDSLSAVCRNGRKKYGTVRGKGKIVINSIDEQEYDVSVVIRNFPARYELGDIYALVNADLNVSGVTPPMVYGDIEIISASYRENFSGEEEGWIVLSSLQEENSWDLNLNMEAKSNLWIKNDDIDAELAGSLNFIRENDRFRYIGTMQILRGKAFLPGRTFRIEPGATISYEDIDYPNPRLDIFATTKIRGTSPDQFGGIESSNLDLRIHVTGTLDMPYISVAPGSPFSNEDLLTLLLLDYDPSDTTRTRAGDPVGRQLTSGISSFLGSQIGRIGSRTLGVETLEIDPVYSDKFDPLGTKLTLGFYTHPNLYIYGRSSISGHAGQEVGFEYRMKRFLLIEARRDEDNLYHLNLNYFRDY
jgi:hypothetical protein